eukprot:TRINITY_DN3718_c0_g1_i3.p1 TRINITY_DN3718_c0_g1~~TRINITY_DN3718_c0_g1_i3.p1  ORF type:complete len:580 (-),score=142.30 TRINITY_DN3718_c0_g1_i3:77-1816(-)
MLQLAEEFALKQVFEKIPKERLVIPRSVVDRTLSEFDNDPELKEFRYGFLLNQNTHNSDGSVNKIKKSNPSEERKDVVLDQYSSGLKIVGYEKDGIIFVCHFGYSKAIEKIVTFIDSFHIKKLILQPLYSHSEIIMCVGCSFNHERTLLALTKKELKRERVIKTVNSTGGASGGSGSNNNNSTTNTSDRPSNSPGVNNLSTQLFSMIYYESILSEVNCVNPRCYAFNKVSEDPQSVYFVCSPMKSGSTQTETICYIYQGRFRIYQIQSKHGSQGTKITSQLREHITMVDQTVWSQWVPSKPLLYLITKNSNTTSKGVPSVSANPSNSTFFCYSFSDKKGVTLNFRASLMIKLETGDKLSVVKLASGDDTNIVLCQQHYSSRNDGVVKITLYLLQHDAVLDFSVVLPTDASLHDISVYFDTIGDLVVIYIPSYYFQLVHCSLDDEPRLGFCFTGADLSTPIPSQKNGKFANLSTFFTEKESSIVVFPTLTSSNPTNPTFLSPQVPPSPSRTAVVLQRVPSFEDRENGTIYRFRLRRETILNIFEPHFQQKSRIHYLLAINLAIVYMQDSELGDEFEGEDE